MKFEPLHDNVAIILDEEPTMAGKIKLPDNVRSSQPMLFGKVVAIGPGYVEHRFGANGQHFDVPIKVQVEVGDRVAVARYNADQAMEDAEKRKIIVIGQHSILAKIKE